MADHLPIETIMMLSLKQAYKSEIADKYISRYFAAKSKLFEEILPWIRTNEPQLSDHGPDHIDNVLNNAYKLIMPELDLVKVGKGSRLSAMDVYALCQTILFHDVGNFFGRERHNQAISRVFNEQFSNLFEGRDKNIIIKAGRAHTGAKGEDTLATLDITDHIDGEKVHLRDIAAIVRFADELAEGPQRTSKYMLAAGKFNFSSKKYHEYADITSLHIDRGNNRISVQYRLDVTTNKKNDLNKLTVDKLTRLLPYILTRIEKLDQERKYAKYYCNLIEPIKKIEVSFNIECNKYEINFPIEQIILDDLEIPSQENGCSLQNKRDDLTPSKLIPSINDYIKKSGAA